MLVFTLFVLTPLVLGLSQPRQPSSSLVSTGSSSSGSQASSDAIASSDSNGQSAEASASANSFASSDDEHERCPRRCKPTCSTPNPKNCKPNEDCNCEVGFVWSDDLTHCVAAINCSVNLGCNGDPNAFIISKPPACPYTCEYKNESSACMKVGLDVGCVCSNPHDILSKEGGVCMSPHECPGGNPCGGNKTFSYCHWDCSDIYCPVDDSRSFKVCDAAKYPCTTGCVCEYRYKRKSHDDPQCILSEECPPVECTRPNEEWDRCPVFCFTDSCSYALIKEKSVCNNFRKPECYPQCVCKKNFARNANEECVPIEECPKEIIFPY